MGSVFCFIEGILFAFFCFEIGQEQMESIVENQTYIDSEQERWGRPMPIWYLFKQAMGHDILWWWFPSTPLVKINYLEKLYTERQVMREKIPKEDDYDVDKKEFARLQQWIRWEKRVWVLLFTAVALAWFFLVKDELIAYWAEIPQ